MALLWLSILVSHADETVSFVGLDYLTRIS